MRVGLGVLLLLGAALVLWERQARSPVPPQASARPGPATVEQESTESLRAFASSVAGRAARMQPGERVLIRKEPRVTSYHGRFYAQSDFRPQPWHIEDATPDFLFERAVSEAVEEEIERAQLDPHARLREFVQRVRAGAGVEWLDPALAAFAERDYAGAERLAVAAAAECERSTAGAGRPLLQVIEDAGGALRAQVARRRAALLLAGDAQWLQAKDWDAKQSYRAASRLVSKADPPAWLEIEQRMCQLLDQQERPEEALGRREEMARLLARWKGAEDRATLTARSFVAWDLEVLKRLPEAEKLLLEIFALRTRRFGLDDRDVAVSLFDIARFRVTEGYTGLTLPPALKALTIRRRVLPPAHPAILQSLRQVAEAWRARGSDERGEKQFREALAMSERLFGPQHAEVAGAATALVEMLSGDRRKEEAEPIFRRLLAIQDAARRPEDDTQGRLADRDKFDGFLSELGKPAEYEGVLREELAACEKEHGPEHPATARSIVALAEWLEQSAATQQWVEPVGEEAAREAPQRVEATALFRRALSMCDRLLGDEPEAVPDLLLLQCQEKCLASLDGLVSDEVAEADHLVYRWTEAHGRRLKVELDRLEARRGPLHPEVADRLWDYANFVSSWRKPMEAEPFKVRAFEILAVSLDPEEKELIITGDLLSDWYEARGALAEAEALPRRLLARLEAQSAPHPEVEAWLLARLADMLEKEGRPAEAEPLLRRAEAAREKGKRPPLELGYTFRLARFLWMEGRPIEAVPYFRRLVVETASDPHVAQLELAEALGDAGEYAEAEAMLGIARASLVTAGRSRDEAKEEVRIRLGVLRAQQGRYAEARQLLPPKHEPSVWNPPPSMEPMERPPRRRVFEFEPREPTGPTPPSLAEYQRKQDATFGGSRAEKYRAVCDAALVKEVASVRTKPAPRKR